MTIKIIETKDIPTGKQVGKTSKVPELLKQIPKGKTAEIQNSKEYKIATIRSYLEKAHLKGEKLDYSLAQRTLTLNGSTEKTTILYVTHETNNLPKPEPKIKRKPATSTDIPLPKLRL